MNKVNIDTLQFNQAITYINGEPFIKSTDLVAYLISEGFKPTKLFITFDNKIVFQFPLIPEVQKILSAYIDGTTKTKIQFRQYSNIFVKLRNEIKKMLKCDNLDDYVLNLFKNHKGEKS